MESNKWKLHVVLDGNSAQKCHILQAQQANVDVIATIKVVKILLLQMQLNCIS